MAEHRIGKHFREAHKNILQAFDRLLCSAEFSRLNFEPRDFIDSRGKPQRTTQMTKDCSTASATACGRNALLSPEYQRLKVEPLIETYAVGNGATRETRTIRMTKDSFMFLALVFSKAEAGRIKEVLIAAFKAMADQ